MKRTVLSFAIAVTVLLGNTAPTYSQNYVNTPVTISKEKVKIDGKIFYSHIVLEKQTLFSISKAYEISTDDIYKYNPTLKDTGLKKNSIIIIPVKTDNSKEASVNHQVTPSKEKEIRYSETQQIIKAEKITEPEIVKTENNGQTVIEEDKNDKKPAQTRKEKAKKKNKIHTVRWYEDLDTIAEKYGITVDVLMRANNLTGRKLSNRQKLVIPTDEEIKEIEELQQTAPEDKPEKVIEIIVEPKIEEAENAKEEESSLKNLFKKNKVDISMILPLKADGISASRNNMDFYAGALIASQELGEQGINIDLHIYDISDQNTQISKEMLVGNDVVIGPVSSGNLSNTLNIASGNCQIVSPLDPRAENLAQQNWNFIQVPTPHRVLYRELTEWIRDEKAPGDSIIFITERGARDHSTYTMLRSAADSTGLSYRTFTYSILEGRDILEPLAALMTDKAMNRFIVASESEAFVNDVVRNLNLLIHNKYNVTLYAPAKIRNFETMEVENLHNTNLHICLGYDIDYNSPEVRNFLMKFRALYNVEPSQFAFQGYDIAKYYIKLCHKYGKRWAEVLDNNDEEMLQSSFNYRRVDNGGWVNEGVRKIIYDKDWTIKRL